jgi:hypothetical protein
MLVFSEISQKSMLEKTEGQSKMDNPETRSVLCTQDTRGRQRQQQKHNTICVCLHYT